MPVEAEVLLAFRVAADSWFLNHRFDVWFAEGVGLMVSVGALGFKYPAAPWAFQHNFVCFLFRFVWCKSNRRRIQRQRLNLIC
jgi:hypothetical protein